MTAIRAQYASRNSAPKKNAPPARPAPPKQPKNFRPPPIVHPLPTAPRHHPDSLRNYWKTHLPSTPSNCFNQALVAILHRIPEADRRNLVGYSAIWGTHRYKNESHSNPATYRYVYHCRIESYRKAPKNLTGIVCTSEGFYINPHYTVTVHRLQDTLPPLFRNLSQRPSKGFPKWQDKDYWLKSLFLHQIRLGHLSQLQEIVGSNYNVDTYITYGDF